MLPFDPDISYTQDWLEKSPALVYIRARFLKLRNIHISNDNISFTFYADVFFPISLPRLLLSDLSVYMSNTAGVL